MIAPPLYRGPSRDPNVVATEDFARQVRGIPFLQGREVRGVEVGSQHTLKVRHGLGRPYQGFFCLNASGALVENPTNPAKDREIWLDVAAPWSLIEEKNVAASVSAVTFSGLAGNVDEAYRFEILWETTLGVALTLKPNGLSTNVRATDFQVFENPSSTITVSTTSIVLARSNSVANPDGVRIEGTLSATTGAYRYAMTSYHSDTGTYWNGGFSRGAWGESVTEITSLEFATASTNILAGSTFRLFRRGLNGRTLDFWVY